jgi:hypothetical protein
LPAFSDAGTDTGLRLDVFTDPVGNEITLRVRRGSTIGGATTFYADVKVFGANAAMTLSTATGTGATVAGYLNSRVSATRFASRGGGSTSISTGTGTVKMTNGNNANNSAWIPFDYNGATYYIPAWTAHAP